MYLYCHANGGIFLDYLSPEPLIDTYRNENIPSLQSEGEYLHYCTNRWNTTVKVWFLHLAVRVNFNSNTPLEIENLGRLINLEIFASCNFFMKFVFVWFEIKKRITYKSRGKRCSLNKTKCCKNIHVDSPPWSSKRASQPQELAYVPFNSCFVNSWTVM